MLHTPPPTPNELRRRPADTPLYGLLGVELEHCDTDEVRVRVAVDERHANLDGWMHGGVMALIADTAMGFAARLHAPATARNQTLSVSLSIQGCGRVGDGGGCTARVSNRSRRFIGQTYTIRRVDDGRLMAEGSALHYPSAPAVSEAAA